MKASASLPRATGLARGPQAERPPYAQYREIFPGGLMYYTRATMENMKQRLDFAVDKFIKYQRDLGADLVEEFTALRTSWVSARGTPVSDKGEVSEARGGVRNRRRTLELQVLDNLLTLARLFKGQPERGTEFFDQSLLEDPVRNAVPAATAAPELAPA